MKLRRQKALDPITPAEQETLAARLFEGETFAAARARIAQPRDQHGYDLRVSIKTLHTLHTRYTDFRRFTQKSPQPLHFAEYLDLHSGEPQPHTLLAQAHMQKMAYAILTTEGSNLQPADLLRISRLLALPLQQRYLEHKMEISARLAAATEHRNQIAEKRHQLALLKHTQATARTAAAAATPAAEPSLPSAPSAVNPIPPAPVATPEEIERAKQDRMFTIQNIPRDKWEKTRARIKRDRERLLEEFERTGQVTAPEIVAYPSTGPQFIKMVPRQPLP